VGEKILEIKNFNVTYKNSEKKVYAVKDANFSIDKGDSLGIVRESGSGKSTLAMAVLRLLPEDSSIISGEAIFLGKNILELSEEELRNLRWDELSVVFQKSMNSLSPVHKIGDQIQDIYKVHRPDATEEEIREKCNFLFKLVNLSDRVYDLYPHELSGGMLQRISIAISLIHDPSLLILDEATTALDVVTQGQILDEIRKMETELNMTRIMITHDMSVVAASCNKIAVMYAGEFMEVGYAKDILKNPKHPYTVGLIKSFPALKGEKTELKAIKGYLPDLSEQDDSCIFASRCEHATEKCKTCKPASVQLEDGRTICCHLYGGKE